MSGKKIFITGHTGFTGSWACLWLQAIGADVYGYSLKPTYRENLFEEAGIHRTVRGEFADIRDFSKLNKAMSNFKPDLVLHLAAQPIVSEGYRSPRETFEINSQGTANVLEAVKNLETTSSVLCITTDKVYRNDELGRAFVETDPLGGKDPYSASKTAAEITIESYRRIFDSSTEKITRIAVARGGNIIGGGDWAKDRLIPDLVSAYRTGSELTLRYPNSTRPWQHVLSLVTGYMQILAGLLGSRPDDFNRAFNLGPFEQAMTVSEVVNHVTSIFGNVVVQSGFQKFSESKLLELDSSLAKTIFGWDQIWGQKESIEKTANWYREFLVSGQPALDLCKSDLDSWRAAMLLRN